jgi:heptosyltransferase I
MRVLIVKTSSMGDVIHTLPALTDAIFACPGLIFDWVIEEDFAEIPTWHHAVDRIIPCALRRWRKKIFSRQTYTEWQAFRHELKLENYDLIIDAQGLLKSALLALFARGKRVGLAKRAAREKWAALFYQQPIFVDKKQHAVTRTRELFAKSLGYELPQYAPRFGLSQAQFKQDEAKNKPYLVFLHGTSWSSKEYPLPSWIALFILR